MKKVEYCDLVKAVEENNLKRFDEAVAFFVGYYGSIDRELYQQIMRLYVDGFINY